MGAGNNKSMSTVGDDEQFFLLCLWLRRGLMPVESMEITKMSVHSDEQLYGQHRDLASLGKSKT